MVCCFKIRCSTYFDAAFLEYNRMGKKKTFYRNMNMLRNANKNSGKKAIVSEAQL